MRALLLDEMSTKGTLHLQLKFLNATTSKCGCHLGILHYSIRHCIGIWAKEGTSEIHLHGFVEQQFEHKHECARRLPPTHLAPTPALLLVLALLVLVLVLVLVLLLQRCCYDS